MRRRTFLAAAVAAVLSPGRAFGSRARAVRVLRLGTGAVESVPLEEYVAAVITAEMGNALPAALEAQAVAARSYTLGKRFRHEPQGADLCDGTHCHVYRGRTAISPAARRAADATAGLVLLQGGRVISAPYHGACGGQTARPVDVWDDEEQPDLPSVVDDVCQDDPTLAWAFRIPRTELASLGERLGVPGARLFEIYSRTEAGRVSSVRLLGDGKLRVVSGFAFRMTALDLWGASTVRSTAFSTGETRSDYVLSGRGFGHGAGLCQRGAMARARRGETREAILSHYYGNTLLRNLDALPETT